VKANVLFNRGVRAQPASKQAKPLTRDEQLQLAANIALQQSGITRHIQTSGIGGKFRTPGWFNKTATGLGEAGLYAVPGLAISAKNVGQDIYATRHGNFSFKRSRKIGSALAHAVPQDIRRARHGDFSGVILDAAAVASAGAGTGARVAATGRALKEGEAVGKALTRKGYEGGSVLHAPEPGTVKLKVGEATVEKPLSRNAALRQVQKARYRKAQHRLDEGPVAEPAPTGPARLREQHGPESLFGKEVRHQRRLEQAHAHGEFTHVARATKRLSRGEHAAMRVLAIEGKSALRNPDTVIARHITTHQRLIHGGGDRAAHEAAIIDLKAAGSVLEKPSKKFLAAVDATRNLANLGGRESIARGFLTAKGAAARKQAIADIYGAKAGPGSFYFHAGPVTPAKRVGRFYNPRPGETGIGKVTPSRYAPELGRQFTGKGIRRGHVPLNIPRAVMQAYGRRIHLHSAQDLYETLKKASTETRESRYQIPLRATTSISRDLKRYLATVEENLHASPDELHALTRDEIARLESELRAAEHANAPLGANIKGVRWVDKRFIKDMGENPERGVLARTADAITNPTRFATLYLRPAYILNALGNAGMLSLEGPGAAHALWEAARAEAKHGTRNTARMDAAMGSGRALGQVVKTGFMHNVNEKVAGAWNAATDLHMRRSAFLHEAKRLGFSGKEDINRLLHDTTLRPKLNEVTRRARKIIGDYEDLGPTEKNAIRRIAYFYPWTKVATKWTGHLLGEHPIKTAALAANSRAEAEHAKKLLGKMPEWTRVAGLVPVGKEHGGLLKTVNPSSVNTPATVVQTGAALANTARGLAGQAQHGSVGLGDILTPAAEAFLSTGAPTSGQASGIPGVLESTPIPSALRRAGVYGKPSKTYPDQGLGPALGPLGVGGLYERNTSLEQLHKQGRREDRATMSSPDRVTDDFHNFHAQFTASLHGLGFKEIPQAVQGRLALAYDRAQARAKLGKDPTALQKFGSDVKIIRSHGWVTDEHAREALRWARTASKDDLSKALGHLTRNYFDHDGVLSSSLGYLNALNAYDSALRVLVKAGHLSRQKAQALRKSATSTDLNTIREAVREIRAANPTIHFPDATPLKIPH
jgi:hypothetical protein